LTKIIKDNILGKFKLSASFQRPLGRGLFGSGKLVPTIFF